MWIAFKNYYLRDEEQRERPWIKRQSSCELLSKIIIFVTRNNHVNFPCDILSVVNCFQKLLSSWRGTTNTLNDVAFNTLWIAFKNYYLRDEEQRWLHWEKHPHRCELLSKIIIFVTRNNFGSFVENVFGVVNCFQKLLSSWRGTTRKEIKMEFFTLWIAFKNYYLRDEEQLSGNIIIFSRSCELLSKIIIFVTRNNDSAIDLFHSYVVNCFQKLLSSWRGTTFK